MTDPVRVRQRLRGHWTPAGLARLTLTATVIALCAYVALPFVPSLAWSAALAVIAWPVHRRLRSLLGSADLAAVVGVLAVTLVVFGPVALMAPVLIDEAQRGIAVVRTIVAERPWTRIETAHPTLGRLLDWVARQVDLGAVLGRAGSLLTSIGTIALRWSLESVTQLALTAFFLFYFLRDAARLIDGLVARLPLATATSRRLLAEIGDTVVATLFGKVVVGLVQGMLGGLALWLLDVPGAWFWAVLMALLSIVPLLGPPLVWVPIAVALVLSGRTAEALGLFAWGALVVGFADNVLYPVVVGRYLRMHPVALLVAMIGGVVAFGAVGFVIGPVLLTAARVLVDDWRPRGGAGARPDPGG